MSMARFCFTYIGVISICLHPNIVGLPVPDEDETIKASNFLEHYGYLDTHFKLRRDHVSLDTDEFKNAIRTFQNLTHLNITGELDDATREQMVKPRCGLPDIIPKNSRWKRYAVHPYKWAVQDLSYRILKYSQTLPVNDTEYAILKALQMWSSVAQIDFFDGKTRPLAPVNIAIGFYTGNHGDSDPFDGGGGTLAHAYFPPFGDLHFDDAENFTLNSENGTNILAVATHELGHSLGLQHSFVPGAVMYPYYQPYDPHTEYKLHSDDIAGIQFLYGARGEKSESATTSFTPSGYPAWRYPGSDICRSESIDAMYHDSENGLTTVFKGAQYWVMDYYGVKIGYPKHIKITWPPFPTNIDAAFYWPANPKIGFPATVFIFKDNVVYRMMDNNVITAEPISRVFPGLPNSIDSAVAVVNDNVTYFTKDQTLYYCNIYDIKSNDTIKYAIPQVLRWYVTYVDAAVYYKNHTYIFVRSKYYGYDKNGLVLPGYPKSIATDWHGCTGNIPREEERDRRSSADQIKSTLSLIILHLLLFTLTRL